MPRKISAFLLLISIVIGFPGGANAITVSELLTQIAALQVQIAALQSQVAQSQSSQNSASPAVCQGIVFSRSLSQGMTGDDIKCLQAFLNQSSDTQVAASGVGSSGNETTFFGALTKAAVVKFQEKYSADVLTPIGLSAGTGFVGAKTAAKLNNLLAGAPAAPVVSTLPPTENLTGEDSVALAADTPAASVVAKGAQDVIFTKISFCAASEANTVSKIVLKRNGIASDSDIANVKLYEGVTQVGSTQAVNTTTHKVTFSSLNWTIPANSCKTLTVTSNVATGATQGNAPNFEIGAAADITSTVALSGVFPVKGANKTIAGISSGWVIVSTTTPAGGTIVAGGVDQDINGFNFAASSTEAVKINSVKFTEVGSSVDDDVSNIKLWYGSTQLGSTVASLTNGKVTFDMSASPLEILAGSSKSLKVTVNVGSSTGVNTRTIAFEMTDATYVIAYGADSGGKVPIYGVALGTDVWPQNNAPVSVNLGTLTIAKDESYSPSGQDYTKGTTQNKIIAFKFTAGANEGVRITQIKLQEASSTLADSDVSNVTLYDAVTGEQLKDTAGNLIPASGQISGFVTFGSYTTGLDATGLLDIPASTYKTILVKADVPSGAATNDVVLGYKINNPTTDVKADGLSSKNDLAATDINSGGTTAIPSTDVFHDIIANGTLVVAANSSTPAAATYAVGNTDLTFAMFDFTTTGEDITITQLNILFATDSDVTATTTNAEAADINNFELWDGATLIKSDPTISSGLAEFGLNFVVPKNSTKTLTVKADIPTGSDAANLTAHIDSSSYITASGNASAQTITATAASWSVRGNLMTKGTPTLTITAATTPVSQTYIKSQTNALMGTLFLAASSAEDIKVTTIKIVGDATDTTSAGAVPGEFDTADSDDFLNLTGNIKLCENTTCTTGNGLVGTVVSQMTGGTNFDYADFTGLTLNIPKGTTKTLDVRLEVMNSSGSSAFYFVGLSTSTDVSANGTQSGTAATISMGAGVATAGMVFGSSGTLNVAKDVSTPVSALIIEGTTGANASVFGKWKFTANNEAIQVTKLFFDITQSSAATSTSVGKKNLQTALNNLATTDDFDVLAFDYSINGGATQTCDFLWNFAPAATTVANLIDTLNSTASSTNCVDEIVAQGVDDTNSALSLSSSGTDYSLQIFDHAGNAASNTANTFGLGLKYGGVETLGSVAGNNSGIVKATLYDDATLLGNAFVGAVADNAIVFGCDTCTPLFEVSKGLNKVISVKLDLADYISAVEGSNIILQLGNTDAASDTDYVFGKGKSSGANLATSTILDSASAVGAIGALTSNAMHLYASKPTVAMVGTPTGTGVIGTNQEVFRFSAAAAPTGFDITMNTIKFTLVTTNATATWDKIFNLYRSDDLSTIVGWGISHPDAATPATSTDSSGQVVISPRANHVIGSGVTATYILKGNTSEMNYSDTTNENLTVSIDTNGFYWDEGVIGNANVRTPGLPTETKTLSF